MQSLEHTKYTFLVLLFYPDPVINYGNLPLVLGIRG